MSAQPALLLLLVIGQIQFWLIPVIAWILLKGQRDTAAGFWFAGTACYACAATLFGLQMQVANLDLRVPAFALMSLMVLLFAESLRRELSNRPTPWLPIVAIPLLHAALMTWLDRIGGNDALMLGQLAVMTVLDVGCATLLVAVAWRRRSRALLIVLVGFLAAIPTNLLRIYAYLAHGESPALLTFTTRSNLGFVVNYLSVVVYSFGYWGFVIEKSRAALSRESSER